MATEAKVDHEPTRDDIPPTAWEPSKPEMAHTGDLASHHVDVEAQNGETKKASTEKVSAFKALGFLDRFLAVWIFLAMIIGVLLGNFVPETGPALQKGKFVGVSVPIGEHEFFLSFRQKPSADRGIAVGLLVMMYPILCKVRYETLHELFSHRAMWKQILFSIFINWIVAPFVMVCIHTPWLESSTTRERVC